MPSKVGGPEDRLRLAFGWTVLAAWAISFVLEAVIPSFQTPPGVQPIALIVVGWLFGSPVAKAVFERKQIEEEE